MSSSDHSTVFITLFSPLSRISVPGADFITVLKARGEPESSLKQPQISETGLSFLIFW